MSCAVSFNAAAFRMSCSCSTLVALAIGAVTLGRAINQASATCAGVALSSSRYFIQRLQHTKAMAVEIFLHAAATRALGQIRFGAILAGEEPGGQRVVVDHAETLCQAQRFQLGLYTDRSTRL